MDRTRLAAWGCFAQRAVRSPAIVIGDVRRQNSTQIGFAEDNEIVQTLRSRRPHPSLSDGIGSMQPERRANLPYPEAPQATIEACSIAAVAIMNQKSRRRSIQGAAFHDLLCDPASCRMPRHFNVEDLSVCESDDADIYLGHPDLPIRPGCAFGPKGYSRQPCVRSELEALPGIAGRPPLA
jgi:hypothetical protein